MKWWKFNVVFYLFLIVNDNLSSSLNQYSSVMISENELIAAVRFQNNWNYININNQIVIQKSYTFADNFSNGWACVNSGGDRVDSPEGVLGGSFYLINSKGKSSNIYFSEPIRFHEKRAIFKDAPNQFKVLNEQLDILASGFTSLLHFSEGLAAAARNDSIGYINLNGKWQLTLNNDLTLDYFKNGLARARKNGLIGYIDKMGNWVIPPQFQEAYPFNDQLAVICQNNLCGAIDNLGNIVIPFEYEDMTDFSETIAGVKKNGLWGYINDNGELITDFLFENVRVFSEGLAAVMANGKVGYIDKTGKMVIPNQFEAGYEFKNGYSIVKNDEKLGYIDSTGRYIIPPIYDRANHFVNPFSSNDLFRIN